MEKQTEVELEGVKLSVTNTRSLERNDENITREDEIETGCGLVHVEVQGDQRKPAILTYHDIGLNSTTCFQGFFSYEDMQPILSKFCVYHVNAPGQQQGAMPLPQGSLDKAKQYKDKMTISTIRSSESEKLLSNVSHEAPAAIPVAPPPERPRDKRASLGYLGDPRAVTGFMYPTMDQLASMIDPVLQFYKLKSFIAFGVGAGANVLCRYALQNPDKVDALVLINCTASKAGWTEWGYQKFHAFQLKAGNLSASAEEYLLWHWFGKKTMETNWDLVKSYKDNIKTINPTNLALFIESYIKRTDLGIVREIDPTKKSLAKNFKCPVMLVAGETSPHLNDTVNMNGRLDPSNSNWMKFDCGGMVLEEQPEKLAEAFRLFLQSMGYVPSLSQTKIHAQKSAASRASMVPSAGGDAVVDQRQTVC